MADTYTCDHCHQTFEKEWSDEDASAESLEQFGVDITTDPSMAIVCDDCYRMMIAELPPQEWRAALAGATGITVTPVTTHDASDVTMVILRYKGWLPDESRARMREAWIAAAEGTDLQHARTVVLDERVDVEFVRGRV